MGDSFKVLFIAILFGVIGFLLGRENGNVLSTKGIKKLSKQVKRKLN